MTIPVSTVKTAKLFIYNAIGTLLNDPKVLVSYDMPGPNQPEDIIVVGTVDREIEPSAMVGSGAAHWLQERYTIEVLISVYRGGDVAQTTFERACDLVDLVIQAVRTDPSLGGAVTSARPVRSVTTAEWEQDHKGRIVDATVDISCFAQI